MPDIVFAAGCFWGVEDRFSKIYGVTETLAGYAGGTIPNPTYALVSTGKTGYAESVKVTYDEAKITLPELMDVFFIIHNPCLLNKQGVDVGTQYRSAVFYRNKQQLQVIQDKIKEYSAYFTKPIVTEVSRIGTFYPAEKYHQEYVKNHGDSGFCASYRPSDNFWKRKLSEVRYFVMRENGTERPKSGKYWDFFQNGFYRCGACGQRLFPSSAKFKCDCGWPSFTASYPNAVNTNLDLSHFMIRKEVTCSLCDGHLGHLFKDGPAPDHKRYCINSAALSFEKA